MWQDVFRSLVSWFPLNMKGGQSPQILTTQTNPIVVGTGASTTQTIELPGDCDIEIDDWVAFTSLSTFPTTLGFRVSIYYGNRDWGITNSGVRGECIFGTAQRPGRIGYRPWLLNTYGTRGLLTFDFVSLHTDTLTIEIYVRGHRYAGARQRQMMAGQIGG